LSNSAIQSDPSAPGISGQLDSASGRGPRVALLTPYTGGNLGDAAIQDAVIANLRLRLGGAQFSGITLDCANFLKRHGADAFPLCASGRPFYGMAGQEEGEPGPPNKRTVPGSSRIRSQAAVIKAALKRIPGLRVCLQNVRDWGTGAEREFRHCLGGYHFLRRHNILIVSGGGQLDEEWGGAWGHPFALFKWALLARVARVPYVIASVGASMAASRTSRFLLASALRMARYRSYRDQGSKQVAVGLLQRAARDTVVPDLAFAIPSSEMPRPSGIRLISQGRKVVALSLIAYAKPQSWPHANRPLYDRYLLQMTDVVSQLLERGYFLVIVWSSRMDQSVIAELFEGLGPESKKRLAHQMQAPAIASWKDLVALLLDADCLIASRLHSTILGFLAGKPTIAVSFDRKVDAVMEDLGLTDYLLQIGDFEAKDVMDAVDRAQLHRLSIIERIVSYQHQTLSNAARQYDLLARLTSVGCRN
jgi:polysaccharide pyruvyl transferase WcaK-like protein